MNNFKNLYIKKYKIHYIYDFLFSHPLICFKIFSPDIINKCENYYILHPKNFSIILFLIYHFK